MACENIDDSGAPQLWIQAVHAPCAPTRSAVNRETARNDSQVLQERSTNLLHAADGVLCRVFVLGERAIEQQKQRTKLQSKTHLQLLVVLNVHAE
jgi:hypothetical protein